MLEKHGQKQDVNRRTGERVEHPQPVLKSNGDEAQYEAEDGTRKRHDDTCQVYPRPGDVGGDETRNDELYDYAGRHRQAPACGGIRGAKQRSAYRQKEWNSHVFLLEMWPCNFLERFEKTCSPYYFTEQSKVNELAYDIVKAMKSYIIYKEASDHAREVRDYLRDFERTTGKKIISVDPESRDGIGFCETYDIVEYPTIIALDSNGIMQNMWRGTPLPQIHEVSYYVD